MCCLFTTLLMLGPRAAIPVWWLLQPNRWGATFDTFIIPFLGFIFVPWTTLIYVAVFPGGVEGWDFFWLALGVLADLSSYLGGAYGNRSRFMGTSSTY